MRKAEKRGLTSAKLKEEKYFKKETLPDIYRNVYFDLIRLRKLSKLVDGINLIRSKYDLNDEVKIDLKKLHRKCLYHMQKIRYKYVDGVEKLSRMQKRFLFLYILNYADLEDVSERMELNFKQLSVLFKSIMKILNNNQGNHKETNRWSLDKC